MLTNTSATTEDRSLESIDHSRNSVQPQHPTDLGQSFFSLNLRKRWRGAETVGLIIRWNALTTLKWLGALAELGLGLLSTFLIEVILLEAESTTITSSLREVWDLTLLGRLGHFHCLWPSSPQCLQYTFMHSRFWWPFFYKYNENIWYT